MADKQESLSKIIEDKRLRLLFFGILTAVFILVIYIFRSFVWPSLLALVLYISLRPLFNFLLKYFKNKSLCSSIVIFSILVFVIFPLFFILLMLADQAYEFYQYIQHQFKAGVFNEILQSNIIIKEILDYIDISHIDLSKQIFDFISKTSMNIFSNVSAVITFSINFIISLFLMLLILFFLLKEGEKLSAGLYNNLPFPEDLEKDVVHRLNDVIRVLVAGNLFIMILQGMVLGIGFWASGLSAPLLWATLTSVLSLIPAVGTAIVWVPAVIYLFAKESYISGILLGSWCLLGYLILENVVKTRMFGKRLNFHPLVFFFLLIGSLNTFNLLGVIIGPVLLSLFFSLWEIYKLLDKYRADNRTNQK
ncbi:MAG: AI-2E family transporter [Spirochaetota bacterium]